MLDFIKAVQEYNYYANNEPDMEKKTKEICAKLSIDEDNLMLFYVGMFNSFLNNEPMRYYNKNVSIEVYDNLSKLYDTDSDKFIESFSKHSFSFFYSINSYNKILELFNEFDDIDFESNIKIKAYYIPIITQILEFGLNHFYRGISSLLVDFDSNPNKVVQKKLGSLKNELKKDYPKLINIDVDLRNAISHGTFEEVHTNSNVEFIYETKIFKKNQKTITEFKTISLEDLKSIKNDYLDICSGAILGFLLFMNNKKIFTIELFESLDEKEKYEYIKLLLYSDKIEIKSFSSGTVGSSQLNINIAIKDIEDTNQIFFLSTIILKIVCSMIPDYERYLINYTHPYSIGGMLSLSKEQIISFIENPDDFSIFTDTLQLFPDIQPKDIDYRAYSFHTFPKIKTEDWEIRDIQDNSLEDRKRFNARLILINKDLSLDEIRQVIFNATSKIKTFENKRNPKTPIRHGKQDADIIKISVHLLTNERNKFTNMVDSFVCEAQYYRAKSINRYEYTPFNTEKETVKKWDIYWSKNFLSKTMN